jgi:hypothetical protein
MGVIPIVNENDTLAVAVGIPYQLFSTGLLLYLALVFGRFPTHAHRF